MAEKMIIIGRVYASSTDLDEGGKSDYVRIYSLDQRKAKDIPENILGSIKSAVSNYEDIQKERVLDLYPRYVKDKWRFREEDRYKYIVLGKYGEGGYVCLAPHLGGSCINILSSSELLSKVKSGRVKLLNGIVVKAANGIDSIRGIYGEFEDVVGVGAKYLKDDDVELARSRSKLGLDGDVLVSNDELQVLGARRREFLQSYYIEQSVNYYKQLSSNHLGSWTGKEGKDEKLVELRKLSKTGNWVYAGVLDSGSKGKAKCYFGHSLRYKHHVMPEGMTREEAEKAEVLLGFGIQCNSDFLQIPKEDIKKLTSIQDRMTQEIAFISNVVANESYDIHYNMMRCLHEMLDDLEDRGTLRERVGARLAKAYKGFKSNRLPLPESYVEDVCEELQKNLGSVLVDLGLSSVCGADYSRLGIDDYTAVQSSLFRLDTPRDTKADWYDRTEYNFRHIKPKKDDIVMLSIQALFWVYLPGEYMHSPSNLGITDYRRGRGSKYVKRYSDGKQYSYSQRTLDYIEALTEFMREITLGLEERESVYGEKYEVFTYKGLKELVDLLERSSLFDDALRANVYTSADIMESLHDIVLASRVKVTYRENKLVRDRIGNIDTKAFLLAPNDLGYLYKGLYRRFTKDLEKLTSREELIAMYKEIEALELDSWVASVKGVCEEAMGLHKEKEETEARNKAIVDECLNKLEPLINLVGTLGRGYLEQLDDEMLLLINIVHKLVGDYTSGARVEPLTEDEIERIEKLEVCLSELKAQKDAGQASTGERVEAYRKRVDRLPSGDKDVIALKRSLDYAALVIHTTEEVDKLGGTLLELEERVKKAQVQESIDKVKAINKLINELGKDYLLGLNLYDDMSRSIHAVNYFELDYASCDRLEPLEKDQIERIEKLEMYLRKIETQKAAELREVETQKAAELVETDKALKVEFEAVYEEYENLMSSKDGEPLGDLCKISLSILERHRKSGKSKALSRKEKYRLREDIKELRERLKVGI